MSSTNLNATVARAIAFLTGPLLSTHSYTTIVKLQSVLEANLIALYAPTWSVKEPMRGSGRRCLTLSPACLPPRAIHSACLATDVQWFAWINALGGREFDLFVDPGSVTIKLTSVSEAGPTYQMITVWADEIAAPALPTPRTGLVSFSDAQNAAPKGFYRSSKTVAQQLLEDDEEDENLFNMIADEVSGPIRVAPIMTQFGTSTRSPSPLSSISGYSRCSSRSSNSSSSSGSDMLSSASSLASHSQFLQAAEIKQLRREQKPRAARVFVDNTKTEVTPYDGGKTTVLTGGVMLGGGPKAQKPKSASPSATSNSWRSVRA